MKESWKHRIRVFAAVMAVALTILIFLGVVCEQIGMRRDRNRYPQIGRSFDIGGRTINLYCSGTGSPAVILESGGHTAGFAWIGIQPEIAETTNACWFDRAGTGWSDPGPSPRDARTYAQELHALLHAAKIDPPYVLVGATAAAFHARVFNGLYPDEVAGAVLIHPSDTDVFAHEPSYMKGAMDSLPFAVQHVGCAVLRPVLLETGVLRLIGNPGAGRPFGIGFLNPSQQRELMFLSTNPETARTEGEGCFLDESMAEVRAAGRFGDKPLAVLTNSAPFQGPPQFAAQTADLNRFWFHELQPRLASLSTRGRLILDEKAEEPASVVRTVNEIVAMARQDEAVR